jgi:hypothetical protein
LLLNGNESLLNLCKKTSTIVNDELFARLFMQVNAAENAGRSDKKPPRLPEPTSATSATALEVVSMAIGRMVGRLACEGMSVMKAFRAGRARSAISLPPAQVDHVRMTGPTDKITIEERERWMSRSKRHQERVRIDPARVMPTGDHLDAAVLEEWLEGLVSDADIERYMKAHRRQCNQCQEVYDQYKTIRKTSFQ